MNISTLAKLSGVTPSTIRYYEHIKLLAKVKRKANGYREYHDDDLKQLILIQQAQQVGFSLAEIKALLPTNIKQWNHSQLLDTLNGKIKDIEQLQHQLQQSKRNLQSMIDAITDKPAEISCEENAERLLKQYAVKD
ncbi:MerR family transcriptional regulator [Acinetobacter larvae]|uniref:MerR family transcriptional regulator n=1 Tax=Acinetobacter larvae TaxID=1789224 RepID=A0A1B2LZL8_9GAMM|nr:MerR family transcriptional regulator [Acinetobacter larvae]AOA58390.1 MerR family transcriptional regulator [Acinetobacter larvae]